MCIRDSWWSGRSRKSHGGESDRSVTEPLIAYARDWQRIDQMCIRDRINTVQEQSLPWISVCDLRGEA